MQLYSVFTKSGGFLMTAPAHIVLSAIGANNKDAMARLETECERNPDGCSWYPHPSRGNGIFGGVEVTIRREDRQ
jgi:hypothetical protein